MGTPLLVNVVAGRPAYRRRFPTGLLLHGDVTLLITALSDLLDDAVSYKPAPAPPAAGRHDRRPYRALRFSSNPR